MIPLTTPALFAEEMAAAERVLRSGMLVQGEEVRAFEAALARASGRSHAVAVSNGTAALELALRALGIGPGDEVLCPALTWPSPAHAIRCVGATPVLVDVDADEWNANEHTLAAGLSPRTRAAIAIDQFGNPSRHAAIRDALGSLPIVLDAACSLGSTVNGLPSARYGTVACTSFHPRKVLTTGEGGAILTDDPDLAGRLHALRNHGQAEPGRFVAAAGNERMTELAAAVGSAQVQRLDALCARRRDLWGRYRKALPHLTLQKTAPGAESNYQTFGILVGPPGLGSAVRDEALVQLKAQGVQAGKLSYALHELPQFAEEARAARMAQRSLAHAADIAARGLCAPLFPTMTDDEHAQVVAALRSVLGG